MNEEKKKKEKKKKETIELILDTNSKDTHTRGVGYLAIVNR